VNRMNTNKICKLILAVATFAVEVITAVNVDKD
jgi:hypothetical protein